MPVQSLLLPTSTADPATDASGTQVYAKSGGLYTRSPAGVVSPISGGGGVAGALSFIKGTSAGGAVNISTLGTIDWFYPSNTSNPTTNNGGNYIVKMTGGGVIADGMKWMFAPNWSGASTGSAETVTATAGDELYSASPLNSTTLQGVFANTADVNGGFMFRIPALQTTRVLRIYHLHYNNTVQMDALLTDGSAPAVQGTDTTNQANGIVVWTITFNAAFPGAHLIVTLKATNRSASSPNPQHNMFLGRVQLGTV